MRMINFFGGYAIIIIIGVTFPSCSDPIKTPPTLSGTVNIVGSPHVGQTLTADTEALDGSGTISYQWKRGITNIGTNSNSYIAQSTDVGAPIFVTVTRSSNTGSITSIETNPITISATFNSVTANGSAIQTTTQLSMTFNQTINNITANDISLSGISGIQKGSLNRSGTTYTLPINGFTTGGTLTVNVVKTDYTITPVSHTVTIYATGTSAFTITFTQIADVAPAISGPTLYRASNGGPTSAIITVDNPEQYDSINWQVQNTSVTGSGQSFTLSAANTAYNLIGERFLTVMVMKGGVPYNKTVSFRVEY